MANQLSVGCKHGHPVEDLYRRPNGLPSGHVSCRSCERLRSEKYRLAHPDRIKASTAKYFASHHEECRRRTRIYAALHAESNNAAAAELRAQVLAKLGSVCARCGFSDQRALQVDHVNGGGYKESRLGYRKMYLKILADDNGYQLLCANCNAIKKVENHEVPQRRFFDIITALGGV